VSSERLIRDDPGPTAGTDDPLAELRDPYDLEDGYEEPDDYGEPDEYDPLSLDDETGELDDLARLAYHDSEPVLLVWPQAEYDQVDQRWPEVLEPIGADSWDEYRRHYQAVIVRWSRRGLPPLLLVTGSADGFEEWLSEQGVDPLSVDLVGMADAYGHHLAEQVGGVELPPGPGQPCWCGSDVSYRECCEPLSPR
jgi:hypothetical protein